MNIVYTGTESAPVRHVYKLGNYFVNWYLIETDEGSTVVDAGFSTHWKHLKSGLSEIGKDLTDIKAVVLTHAHPDHIGIAEQARQELKIDVWVHEADAEAARMQKIMIPTQFLRNMWRPATLRNMITTTLDGAMKIIPVQKTKTFIDGDVIPVPGSPKVIHVPGHTAGSCALYLPNEQILFSGDELCTASPLNSKDSPPLVLQQGLSENESLAKKSLTKLEALGQMLLLPGHGKVWRGDMKTAVLSARSI